MEPGPCPKPALLFFGYSSLVSASPPFLVATVQICPLGLREGHGGWSLFPKDKERGTQKGFHAQEPQRVLLGFTYKG